MLDSTACERDLPLRLFATEEAGKPQAAQLQLEMMVGLGQISNSKWSYLRYKKPSHLGNFFGARSLRYLLQTMQAKNFNSNLKSG